MHMHNFYQTSRMTSLLFSLEKIKATRKKERKRERERERERFFLITPFISKLPLVSEKAITCLHICRMYELTYAINYLNN